MIKCIKIILLFVALQLSKQSNAQEVTISLRGASLEEAFTAIEKQTGFNFIFSKKQIDQSKPVNITANKQQLNTFLDLLFADQPFSYTISKKFIAVKDKKKENSDNKLLLKIKGRILDDKGEPVIASVIVKETNKGTTSNADGFFELSGVDDKAILIFSGANINAKEVTVEGQSAINVSVSLKVSMEEEVVINAGYYSVKKRESTGNISRVDAKVIEKQPVTNPLAAIAGRMAGVNVQQTTGIPGGDFKIEIRGRNSLRVGIGGNDPLYIVDGVPFLSEKISSYNTTSGIFLNGASPLTAINLADIESIEVLKDADATAIYGSRGANGVVLITTKRAKVGKTEFNLTAFFGFGKAPMVDLMNTQQYLAMRREAFANDSIQQYPDEAYDVNGTWDTSRFTDWQKELIGGLARSTNIQASISGGNASTQFIFSAGYRKEGSVFPGNFSYNKGSTHLGINHSTSDKKLLINASISGSIDKNNQPHFDFTSEAARLAPNAPKLYTEEGSLNWENSTWVNPLRELERVYDAKVENIICNVGLTYEILKGLQFKSNFGLNNIRSSEFVAYPSTYYDPAEGATSVFAASRNSLGSSLTWIIEPQLNWNKKIDRGLLAYTIGSTLQNQQFERTTIEYRSFPSDFLLHDFSAAAFVTPEEYVKFLYKYVAVYTRLNYNWDGKYIINLTARRDGSSRFGPGRQFGNFGAIGAAWIFSEESFIRDRVDFLTFGKLRFSYGTTGSDQIGNYQFLDTYSTGTSGISYQGVTGIGPTRLFNPVFAWEKNRKIEVALELGFLKDRIQLNTAIYQNRSANQLVNYTLPLTTGFNGIQSNLPAVVQNTGIEIELSTNNIDRKEFDWKTSFNITIPRNKLLSFPNIEKSTYANTYEVGKSIYINKLYKLDGVDPKSGLYLIRDMNNDGKYTQLDDQTYSAFVGQYFFGGMTNTLTFSNWKFDFLFHYIHQAGRIGIPVFGGTFKNNPVALLNKRRWKKPGDISEVQRFFTSANADAEATTYRYFASDGMISDASFIRLKNISISYQFFLKKSKSAMCNVYLQGQNLLTITNYEGYDPETQQVRLPPLKFFTAGIQIKM